MKHLTWTERLKLWMRGQVGLPPMAQECMGALSDAPDSRDHLREKIDRAPLEFSLEEFGIPLAYDQGRTSSCTGHAGAAFIRNLYGRAASGRYAWSACPFWIYHRARERGGLLGMDAGATMRDLMKVLAEDGAAPTYAHISKVDAKPSESSLRLAKFTRIREYQRIVPSDDAPNIMMTALGLEKLPVLVGVRLFSSVNSSDTRWDGILRVPTSSEPSIGGHALMIDSYDAKRELFSGWNSWGKEWGDGGRFYLPFEYVSRLDLVQDMWTGDYRLW